MSTKAESSNWLSVAGVLIGGVISVTLSEGHFTLWSTLIGMILVAFLIDTTTSDQRDSASFVLTLAFCIIMVFGLVADAIINSFGFEQIKILAINTANEGREGCRDVAKFKAFYFDKPKTIDLAVTDCERTLYSISLRDAAFFVIWAALCRFIRPGVWVQLFQLTRETLTLRSR